LEDSREAATSRRSERKASRLDLVLATLLALLTLAAVSLPVSGSTHRSVSTERYALKLVNCLRTGGKVTPAGFCIGYGSGRFSAYRRPLEFSHKISNKVAYPWASRIARVNSCGHSLAGSSVDRRFRTVGLRHITNGENVACHSAASPRQMVAFWVRFWHRESGYGGSHWRQIKDPRFRVAGIGVARMGGRTRLVIDFYGRHVD
jgi:hypothetical protein